MGNSLTKCTSKNSKENKRHMKEEVYRPCQSDTGNQNDPDGQGGQSTQNGIAKNIQNLEEIAKGINVMKNSVDSKCHGNTEEKEQVNMPVKQESVESAIPKSEVIIKLKNTETEAVATDTNGKKENKSKCESMDSKVKVSDKNNSAVTPVSDEPDYTEIKGKPYNFSKGREKPDLPESEFLDTKSGKTEPAHHNEDIKTDGTDQSPDQKDEKGGDPADNKKDENGHSNLLDCDQNGMVKSNGSETEKDNIGQTNDADSIPPKSAPSDGDKSNQKKIGGDEFAIPINNEFKKGKFKGKTDEKFKSKTSWKDRYGNHASQTATTVSHHVINGPVDSVFVDCHNMVVKNETIEVTKETTKTAIHSVETMTILSEVAKSVGHIIGPKESGTCWRVGNDKIITAAHVVVGNIWHQLIGSFLESDLDKFRVDFKYINKESSSNDQFKVVPRVLFMDESLDVAVLQLESDEKKPFPPPLKMFHVLNLEKDDNKQIYLISHNKSKKKEINSGIGIWKPTEKKLQDLEKFCQQYGEENGYLGLERKDRLVIQCDFEGGASGSPGFVILNSVAYVILVYIRGFPSFYHSQKFSKEQRRKFPTDNLFQHGVNIENLFAALSNGVDNMLLRNEIFPEEALKLEQTMNQHKLAISGDKTSSCTETTETSTEIVKGKMDNRSEKSETKIPIYSGTACTDQCEDNIPESANYIRLMSQYSVPGQTLITSPQQDTDRYNITGNQSAQDITSPQEDTDRYNITGSQSAQDIKTGESDKCTVQDQGNHSHSGTDDVDSGNHNLHAKDGEMITLQRSPGNTRPMSAGQISIDEWIGNEWHEHRYKKLEDNDLLLLSKAIHPECFNSVAIHFDLNQMDVEEIHTGQNTDLCCQMLYKWKIKNGEEATLAKLIQNMFSSWISENKSVQKKELKSAISQVTMVSNEEAAS